MLPLYTILPDLEDAVTRRRECPALVQLDEADLRELVYEIVRRYRDDHERPVQQYRMLVQAAVEAHGGFRDAREESVAIRRRLLEQLRDVLGPALPGLLSPIAVETIHIVGKHDQRSYHPVLHGLEVLDGSKWGPVGKGQRAWSGTSWWIVALPPDDRCTIDARYAVAEHRGDVDETHGGRTWIDLRIVTEEHAAAQIRDDRFETLLATVHKRLGALSGPGVAGVTDGLRQASAALEEAIGVLRNG